MKRDSYISRIRITNELKAKIETKASRDMRTVSDCVRMIIEEYFSNAYKIDLSKVSDGASFEYIEVYDKKLSDEEIKNHQKVERGE